MKENMFYGASSLIFQKAEELRNSMTPAEEILWKSIHINEWKLKFRRQHPIANWVVDFYCHPIKLVIEIDGSIQEIEEVKRNDAERENYLRNLGLTILRFKNEEIIKNKKNVLKKISETIVKLQSPPSGDGGKIVLGFSGGLDTTYCVKYLSEEKGYEVHSIIVNTGGFSDDELKKIEAHAYKLGVKTHTAVNAIKGYYDRIIKYLIFGNCLKNNTYPLSVSAERLSQALHIAEHVKKLGAKAVAHGSTGAGNDQVRFDMIFHIMIPGVEIITPVRDLKLSREEEIAYLKSKGVLNLPAGEAGFEKAMYSINKGLWGTSVGGKETLSSKGMLPEEAWPTQVSKSGSQEVKLSFAKGELFGVDDKKFAHPAEAIQFLQSIAGSYGIGRDIHVGDTIIGIKGRVGFEAAAPMIIIKSHHALEKHVLTKWQLQWKDTLAQFYGNWLHEGQILDPVMRDIEAFFENCQKNVTGDVFVQLAPYRFQITGIESKYDLMNSKFGKYGEMNTGFTGEDVRGFSKIFGNQTSIWTAVNKDNNQ